MKTAKRKPVNGFQRELLKSTPAKLKMSAQTLSPEDSIRIKDAFFREYCLAIDVGSQLQESFMDPETRLSFGRNCSPKALRTNIKRMVTDDIATVMKQFKSVLQALRHLPDNGRPLLYPNKASKKFCNKKLVEYVKAFDVDTTGTVWVFIQPYFQFLWFVDTPDVFRFVNDLVQYITRLTLRDVDWIEAENIDDYVAFEEKLHNQKYDPSILAELRAIITRWFSDFQFDRRWVDHGYGATAEVRRSHGTAAKYQNMIPTVEAALLADKLDWHPYGIAWKGIPESYEKILDAYYAGEPCVTARDLACKVQLVPKGVDKKRVVSMEPTVHQFYQKMIGSAMKVHFNKHREINVDLEEQGWNRELTRRGSESRDYGTIDLSSASDSVTLTLVRSLFRDTPLYDALMWCRSTKAELPDGRVVELEKFAPMGSAVCFPVECTVFSAIVAYANKRHGVHTYYRVYGDDIVCHRAVFDTVVELLESLNFIVNRDKSFEPWLPFKESCGIECYQGIDVSPIRLSRKFDIIAAEEDSEILHKFHYFDKQGCNHPEKANNVNLQLDSLYKHGNDALLRGYMTLRETFIHDALKLFKAPIFSHSVEYGFLTLTTNICLPNARERYNPVSNQLEYRVLCSASKIDDGPDLARYSKLLEEYDRSNREALLLPEERIDCRSGAAHSFYKFEWVPYDTINEYRW